MRYREIAPDPRLDPWVECFWVKRIGPETGMAPSRVVPDGAADIVVDVTTGSGSLVGTMLRPKLIPHSHPRELVAVRFRPGGAWPLLGFDLAEITDRNPGLDTVGALGELRPDHLAEARSPAAALERLEAFLLDRLRTAPLPDPLARAAVKAIEASGGRVPIDTVAERLGVGRRKLERTFGRHVGIAPKQLSRVVRFQNALERLDDAPGLREIALDVGYADQPHFNREFKALAGITPGQWGR